MEIVVRVEMLVKLLLGAKWRTHSDLAGKFPADVGGCLKTVRQVLFASMLLRHRMRGCGWIAGCGRARWHGD